MVNKHYFSEHVCAKLPVIAHIIFVGMIIIVLRLVYLQIYCGNTLLLLSKKNYERTQEIVSVRGDILDCNGIALATNRPITNIYWQGTGNYSLQEEQRNIVHFIEQIIGTPLLDAACTNQIAHVEKTQKKLLLVQDVSISQLSAILEHYGNHPNIVIKTDFKRFYPYKTVASHILGYIGQIQTSAAGKMGLEKILDSILRGNTGRKCITINSLGTTLLVEEIEHAYAGADIKTTLDISLQMLAEYIFPTNSIGTLILIEPKTGALKVVLSRPHFDPNLFVNPLSYDAWQKLKRQKPFVNRAFYASYPPASIFKLVTIAAALEEGILTPNDLYECKGHITFGNRRYYCMKRSGHGIVTVKEAFALSCNPLFYTIGQQLSVNTLADYAQRFGLGQPTELFLPEKSGLIPTTSWKEKTLGERWWPGETLSVAIGQSYVLSTPLQIACMISSIFEGYLVQPRILTSESIMMRPLAISDETRRFLQNSMRLVVTQGTGKCVNTIDDIYIWAKTGTAQTSNRQRRKLGKQYPEYAWFVAYFHYKNYDPLTLVILVEQAISSREAIILAKRFFIRYRMFMQEKEK